MSAVSRYRTLVNSVGKIYASDDTERTQLLQDGLDEIVSAIGPENASQWKLVKADSERLLNVWRAKENIEAAENVVTQLVDILNELASSSVPTLVVSDDSITHIHDRPAYSVVAKPVAVAVAATAAKPVAVIATAAKPVAVIATAAKPVKPVAMQPVQVMVEKEEEEEEAEETEEEAEEAEEAEEEEAEEAEEEAEEAEVEEEEAEEVEVEEVEVEAEEEVEEEVEEVEEEAKVEEEEEAEVEQVTIRGRTYWIDTNTKKLYANDADEVGDEVGAMINGKAVFLSA